MVETSHTAGWLPGLFDPLRTMSGKIADWFAPASEALSDDDAYVVVVELPGVPEDDIHVSVQDRVLSVKGEKKSETERSDKSYYFSERTYGAFQRSFRMPEDADAANVAAEIKDGVLTLRIPKIAPSEPEAQRIKVTKL